MKKTNRNQLNRLYWIKKEIEQLENQIKELTTLTSVNISGMPKGNNVGSPVEQFAERTNHLQCRLKKKLSEYIDERIYIENQLENISDAEVRTIARMRYIDNRSWESIGNELNMDRTTAYKKLKKYERERER